MSPDVIVVGGGVVGASIAYQLAKRGATVTVIDRGEDPGPATPASAGLLLPVAEGARQGPMFEFGRESLRLFDSLVSELRERTGVDVGYRRSGLIQVALNEAEVGRLRLRRSWDERAGMSVTWMDRDRAQEVEPALGSTCQAALFSADAHQVDAPSLADACLVAAVSLGATVHRGATVDSLLIEGDRVAGVRCGLDETRAPEVVLANGAWAGSWSESLECRLPIRPVRGQIVSLRSDHLLPRNIIFNENGYLVRKHDGNIYVGATEEEVGFDSRPTLDGAAGLLQLALRLAPGLSQAAFHTMRVGLRPATPDRLPVIGRLSGWTGVSVATGHFRNGVLLAPITGEIIADLIGYGRPRISIDAFDPARFLVRAA